MLDGVGDREALNSSPQTSNLTSGGLLRIQSQKMPTCPMTGSRTQDPMLSYHVTDAHPDLTKRCLATSLSIGIYSTDWPVRTEVQVRVPVHVRAVHVYPEYWNQYIRVYERRICVAGTSTSCC